MKNLRILLGLLITFVLTSLYCNTTYADTRSDIIDKVKKADLYTCYVAGGLKESVDFDENNGSGKYNMDAFFYKPAEIKGNSSLMQDGMAVLPSYQFGHQLTNDSVACQELFFGTTESGERISPIFPGYLEGYTLDKNLEVLQKLGYTSPDGSSNSDCRRIQYGMYSSPPRGGESASGYAHTSAICISNVNEGKITDNSSLSVVTDWNESSNVFHTASVRFQVGDSPKSINITCPNSGVQKLTVNLSKSNTSTIDFFTEVNNALIGNENCTGFYGTEEGYPSSQGTIWYNTLSSSGIDPDNLNGAVTGANGGASGVWTFKGGNASTAANEALRQLGVKITAGSPDIKFTPEEKSYLHKWYFANVFEAKVRCDGEKSDVASGGVEIKLDKITSKTNCVAIVDPTLANKTVHGISNGMTWYYDYTLEELIDTMSEEDLLTAEELYGDYGSEYANQQSTEDDPCATADLFGMGWLLCSSLKNGTQTLDPLEGMIQQMLAVNPTLYGMYYKGTTNETATYKAWKIIRGVANFLMIVIFLVVIFSQITGHGIDNYGIKKILPKLILGAILINLSFIICELIVDLSNILGQGLDSLFYSIAEGIETSSGSQYNALTMWSMTGIVDAFLSGMALAGAGAGVGGLVLDYVGIDSGGTLVIILLLAVALILIALLIFFASLGARMIIIVVCVAISPVAFALYILPNTQKLFQKWWKLFESALIIYPICGALYGISQLIRVIIFSTGSEVFIWEGVIAVVAPYIPFFAIPLLLKSAISALGVAGAALTAIGSGLRNSTSKAVSGVQNSELYKDRINMAADTHNERALKQAQLRRARLLENGKSTKGIDREIQRLAKRRLQFDKDGVNRDMATNPSRLAAARAGIANQALESEIQGYMAQISNNDYKAPGGAIVDGSNPESVRDALMTEMARPEAEQSYAKQAALLRTLEGKGKAGLAAMGEILDNPIAYTDANRQIVGDMVNNGTLKDQYKSAHEVAKNIQNNMQRAYTTAAKNGTSAADEYTKPNDDKNKVTDAQGRPLAGMVQQRLDSGVDNGQIKPQDLPNIHQKQLESFVTTSFNDPSANDIIDKALASPDVNFNGDQLQTIYGGRADNVADYIDKQYNSSPSAPIESTNAIEAAKLIGSSESQPYISEATTDKVINSLQNYQNRKGGAPIDTELISGGWTKGKDADTLTNGAGYIYHTRTGTFEKVRKK